VADPGGVAEYPVAHESPHGPQLAALARELDAATAHARGLVQAHTLDVLAERPAPGRWSAIECLTHLTRTAAIYEPLLEQTVDAARAHGLRGAGPYRMDLPGRFLRWLLEPPVRVRTRTFAAAEPVDAGMPSEVLPRFVAAQSTLLFQLRAADGVALDRVTIVSPFDRRLRYNLYSCFAIIAAHERRHLWQAERAAAQVEKARGSPSVS
jgi:hypothetical protein